MLVIMGAALSVSGLSLYVSRALLPAKMRRAYRKAITALAVAVETKDSGTVGHAQRVAELTVAVAIGLGITGKELVRIEYAALLRDIGKAIIPQSVLNKNGPLTQAEWTVVQAHTVQGAEMVAAVPFLANAADYVRHHHECWDGSGYPDRLAAEEIPLGSRILAVTSDFDAMTSERPYHPSGMSTDAALKEITNGSGTRYDPMIVKVFVDLIRNNADDKARAS